MNGNYSSHDTVIYCKRDINFLLLLEDAPAPDHAAIARFRTFGSMCRKDMAGITELLYQTGGISEKDIFIDDMKMELCTADFNQLVRQPHLLIFKSMPLHIY